MLLSLNVRNRRVLVVGEGAAAQAKARLLHESGACVRVLARTVSPELRDLATDLGLEVVERAFEESDAALFHLVIAATPEDPALTDRVATAAQRAGVLVNAVDRPDRSDVTFPALVRRDGLEIGIATHGAAPALARLVRGRLEAALPDRLNALVKFAGEIRSEVKATLPSPRARRLFWDRVFQGVVSDRLLSGDEGGARRAFREELTRALAPQAESLPNIIHRFSAGSGDPDLLTLRAQRLLLSADLVLHDRAVSPTVVALARREALRIAVGGRRGLEGDALIDRMIAAARAGLRIVRVTAGDAWVASEILPLRAAGLMVELVPGVAAAPLLAAPLPIPRREETGRAVSGGL